jgi:hypothetical protein
MPKSARCPAVPLNDIAGLTAVLSETVVAEASTVTDVPGREEAVC